MEIQLNKQKYYEIYNSEPRKKKKTIKKRERGRNENKGGMLNSSGAYKIAHGIQVPE